MWNSFVIRVRTEIDMRRELQGFELRLSNVVKHSSPDFRDLLLHLRMAEEAGGELVLKSPSRDETFEQMRVRITKRIQLPMWPGVVFGALGFALLSYSLATSTGSKRA